jgi:hypothetical protein
METKVTERIVWNKRYLLIAVILAALVVCLALFISLALQFDIVQNLVMSWVFTTFYAVAAFFLLDAKVLREVRSFEQVPVVERVEVPVQVPIFKEVIKEVEKPVIQTVEIPKFEYRYVDRPVIRKVTKTVYVEKARKKLNIPKFNFVGSSEEKRFHTRFCRLGKLIKKSHKVHSNTKAFFKRKHFKACKVCILKVKRL